MEKFGLLNLIKALSGQSEQSPAEDERAAREESTAASERQPRQDGAQQQANILADIIERHDKISYRLKNKRK